MESEFFAVVLLGLVNTIFCLFVVLRLAGQSEREKGDLAKVLERLAELAAAPDKQGAVRVHQFERSHATAVQQLKENEQVRAEQPPPPTVFGQAPMGISED